MGELLIFLAIAGWFGWRWYRQAAAARIWRRLTVETCHAHDAYLAGEISDTAFVKRTRALEEARRLLEARL